MWYAKNGLITATQNELILIAILGFALAIILVIVYYSIYLMEKRKTEIYEELCDKCLRTYLEKR